jgi:ferrochelatase
MRRYLKEFLSDRRVIETNPIIWQFILNAFVLTTRPKKSGHAYGKIWNRELNESPLKTITRGQAEKLAARLGSDKPLVIDWAMRYGNPPIADRLKAMVDQGCDRVLIFPLYPQYSAATTATVQDKAFDALKLMRWQPALRTVPAYFDHPAYIDALARSLEDHLSGLTWRPDLVVASYHGLPEDYHRKGDPYYCHCHKTTRLLRERLGWPEEAIMTTFQSRFGRAEWLKPYTADTIEALPGKGVKNVVVITPGFAADCVETLEEIAIGVREGFIAAGGQNFDVTPCLNDSDLSIDMLSTIIEEELQGWR